jgi:hypothetical protein
VWDEIVSGDQPLTLWAYSGMSIKLQQETLQLSRAQLDATHLVGGAQDDVALLYFLLAGRKRPCRSPTSSRAATRDSLDMATTKTAMSAIKFAQARGGSG